MKKTILIAEDEPNIAFSLEFILGRAGYQIECTADGSQVLPKAHSARPDLIILDIMLQKQSGFDALKALKSRETTKAIPVLVLTAKGQQSDKARAYELGAADFMAKPYANSEVVTRVSALLK